MKIKKIAKKLNLNKKTIANFDGTAMRKVYGGVDTMPLCGTLYIGCSEAGCYLTASCEPICETRRNCYPQVDTDNC